MVYKKDAKHMRTSRDGKMNVRKKQLVSSSRRSSTTSVDSSSRRRRRRPTRRTPDDSSTEASSRVYSTSYDQSSISSSSSSSSETSYHRPRKSTSSKKGRDYRREAEHSGRTTRRRGGGGGRRSTSDSGRNQRRRSPETYRSESTRQTYSTYSTVSTRDHDHHGRGNRSFDTADNSESKLQDIGMVVKASDLSDYSDQFTLDSQDMEEFEEFVQKHENRGYGSESDRSSALYSLTRDSSEKASSEPSDDTSGIVEDRSGKMVKKGGLGNCAYKAYFCMPDDESLQGSYGGLRNGEILIAASTLSSHASMMDDGKDFLPRETSVRSDVRQIERIESYASTVEDRATPESVVTKPPSGLSSYFCSWMTGPNSSAENEDEESDPTSNDEDEDEEDDEDDEEDKIQEEDESRQVHQEETDPQDAASVTASERTRTVAVWERPDDATRDSMDVSLDEDRIHAIAQKARSENILTKFKTEMKGKGKPALIIPVSDSVLQEEAKEVQVPIKESPPLVEDTTQVYTDLPYQRILVLGDNVLVSGISEVEAGNGDTGFIIFLRVSRDSLTEDGVAAAERAAATRRSQLVTRAPTIWQSLDDASFEVLVAVVDDEERLVTETPRLLIENNASHYLENLCQLSEASYYCLDASTKKHARKVIELQQQQDQHRTTLDLQTASTLSRDSPRGNSFVSHSSSVETATQFMFCMKAMDLIYTEKSTVDLGTVVESPIEQSRISQISTDHAEDNLEKHNQNKSKTMLSTALSSRATVDPSETEKFFVKKDVNATKPTSKFIVKNADDNTAKPSTSAAREQNNSKIAMPETPFVAKSSKKVKGNIASSATSGEAIVKTASSVVETPPPPPQSSCVNESEVDEYINDVARSQESGPEYPKQLREALEFMKATPSRSESDRVTVSEDRPRMSRSTVKAHALLQAGKKPRYERPARPAPKKQGTTTGGMPPQKSDDRGVIQQTKQPSPSAVSPPSSGEESSSDRLCNRSFSHHSSGGEDSLQGTRYMEENTPAGSAESFSNHSGGIHGYLAFLDEEDASGGIRTTSTSKLIVETMRAEPKNLLPIDSTTTTTTTQRTVRSFEISTKSALLISKVEKAAQEAREILARIDFRDDREEEEGSRCSSSDHYHSDNAVLSDDSDNKGDQRRRSRIIPHHLPDARGQVVLRADLLTSIDSPPIPTHVAKLLLTPPAAPDVNSTILEITRVHSNSTIDTKMTSEEKQLQSYEERARLSQHLLLADSSARLAARSTIQSVGVGGGGGGGAASTAAEVVEFEKSRIDNWGLSRGRRKTNASVTSSHGSSTSSDEFYDAMSRNSSSNLSENISLD